MTGTFKWSTVEDFVKGISEALLLPNAWTSWKSRGQQLSCADFLITVSIVAGGPSLRVVDNTAEEVLTSRRVAQEEQQSALEDRSETTEEIWAEKESKIYYRKACKTPKKRSEQNFAVFKTAEEAEKAGYKPAKKCL